MAIGRTGLRHLGPSSQPAQRPNPKQAATSARPRPTSTYISRSACSKTRARSAGGRRKTAAAANDKKGHACL